MRVLMFGWELPPFNSGGLGEACYRLTKALVAKGVGITFVLPKRQDINLDFMNVIFADLPEVGEAYTICCESDTKGRKPVSMTDAAVMYAQKASLIATKYPHDVIHSHDWFTYPAGIAAKRVSGKPFIAHIHSSEYDRTGGNGANKQVWEFERMGLLEADRVIANSKYMKGIVVREYGVDPGKIDVVYNAVDRESVKPKGEVSLGLEKLKEIGYKIVLFLGRITLQKGPEYFLLAAKKVLEADSKFVFVVVGNGDMYEKMIMDSARFGIAKNVIFAGFLRGEQRNKVIDICDVYVMPSVSEPFGITALEAASLGKVVIISKQSGVSEVLKGALKVDFWDTDEMANKILASLRYKPLAGLISKIARSDVDRLTWEVSADKCINVYKSLES